MYLEDFISVIFFLWQVFWRKKQVDLVKICDGCLNDTHRAMAEVNRLS
jgi:hypothetical protein